jgi:hypothetical protein
MRPKAVPVNSFGKLSAARKRDYLPERKIEGHFADVMLSAQEASGFFCYTFCKSALKEFSQLPTVLKDVWSMVKHESQF